MSGRPRKPWRVVVALRDHQAGGVAVTNDEYAGHHQHCYIREGQHCSCGRRVPGVYPDRPVREAAEARNGESR